MTNVSIAQTIFYEDFNNGIPPTWTLIDVDGFTPNTNVAGYTDAWISHPMVGGVNQDEIAGRAPFLHPNSAGSNSWYTPLAQADDWIISPAITLPANSEVKFYAKSWDPSFLDAYEVRISTAGTSTADFLANPVLYTNAAENPSWTERTIDLDAAGYANQTVHIAWRNISNDKFILSLDEIYVNNTAPTHDLFVFSENPYDQIPVSQAGAFPVVASSEGDAMTNIDITTSLHYTNGLGILSTQTSNIPAMPVWGPIWPISTTLDFLKYLLLKCCPMMNIA